MRLVKCKRYMHTYVVCLLKRDGELDITTYSGAEDFHPGRMSQGRLGTLQRDDEAVSWLYLGLLIRNIKTMYVPRYLSYEVLRDMTTYGGTRIYTLSACDESDM